MINDRELMTICLLNSHPYPYPYPYPCPLCYPYPRFSNAAYCLAFNEASFYPQRVAQGKVCILKGFSPLIAGFDVQDGFLCANRSPLKTIVSRKVISFSDISAVNFIVGWKLLASLIKSSTSFLLQSQREKMSSMLCFHSLDLVSLCWIRFVSVSTM